MASSPDPCNTGLSLGFTAAATAAAAKPIFAGGHLRFDQGLPSLSLGPADIGGGFSGSPGGSSSYSNTGNSGKRSADHGGDDVEVDKASDEEEEASPRKKLRLTKDQSAVLEDSFKEHSTLNPNQKQALAKRLNLRPRQVEVWFQNRRARTKLKQTEMDCELLKKCCESLSEENKRLQKEVQELKALKLAAAPAAVYMPGAATLSICPSCERFAAASPAGDHQHRHHAAAKAAAKPHQFFSHPSAAC